MLDTLELYEELSTALEPGAARVLAGAMGKLYREIAATVTKEEFAELKAIVADLAEAQKRTEARLDQLTETVDQLAEAQKRTETRVEELAEAQKRTEARLDELAETVDQLAEAQKRTEARVEELAEAQKRTEARVEELAEAQKRTEEEVRQLAKGLKETRQMVGGLSDTVGYVLEDRAIHSLPAILPKLAGVTVEGELERTFIQHDDGRTSELNIFGHGKDAEGRPITILGEAKARLSTRHVDALVKLAQRLREQGVVTGEPQLLLVSYSVTPRAAEHARAKGVLVVPSYKLSP